MQKIDGFKIIGISVETTNENGKSATDLGGLWMRFFSENIPLQIPNKVSDEVYSIYTDYESNYNGKYTSIIGLKVNSLDEIPEGFVGREFESGTFTKFVAKGELPNSIVETWMEIWAKDEVLGRKYTYDYEVHSENSQKGEDSEVEIFIAT